MAEEKKLKESKEETEAKEEKVEEKKAPKKKTTKKPSVKKEAKKVEAPKEEMKDTKKKETPEAPKKEKAPKKETLEEEDKKEAPKKEKAPKKETPEEEDKKEAPKKEKAPKKETPEAPKEKKETKKKSSKKSDRKEESTEEEDKKEAPKKEKETKKKSSKKTEEIVEKPDEEEIKEEKVEEIKEEKKRDPYPEELVFGKFNSSDVVVEDPSLKAFINLEPALVPHSSARHANKPFYKSKISIVERLINSMMRTEVYTGKKTKSYKAVLEAFELIEERTKENPIQILVRALENSAPREEVTRLKFGGISVPKSVDTAPSRRIDIALRNIANGTVKASAKNRKSIAECLANELIAGSKRDLQSFAVSKRDEVERVAKSAH